MTQELLNDDCWGQWQPASRANARRAGCIATNRRVDCLTMLSIVSASILLVGQCASGLGVSSRSDAFATCQCNQPVIYIVHCDCCRIRSMHAVTRCKLLSGNVGASLVPSGKLRHERFRRLLLSAAVVAFFTAACESYPAAIRHTPGSDCSGMLALTDSRDAALIQRRPLRLYPLPNYYSCGTRHASQETSAANSVENFLLSVVKSVSGITMYLASWNRRPPTSPTIYLRHSRGKCETVYAR